MTDPHEVALAYLAKRPTGWHALAHHFGFVGVFNVSPVQVLRDLVAMGYATEAEGLTTITPEGLAEVERSKAASSREGA